jgi:hypothetical protein
VNGWNERVDWPEGQKEVRQAFRGAGAGGGTRPGGATLSGLAAAAGAVQLLSAYSPVLPDSGTSLSIVLASLSICGPLFRPRAYQPARAATNGRVVSGSGNGHGLPYRGSLAGRGFG